MRERKYKNSEKVSKRKKQKFECKNKISEKTFEQQKKNRLSHNRNIAGRLPE